MMQEIGSMASSLSDVEALPETEEAVVDQQAKACNADSRALVASATVTGDEAVLPEQHDDDDRAPEPGHQELVLQEQHGDDDGRAPEPDHQEVPAPEHAAKEPAPEEHGGEKDQVEVEPEAAADDQESTRERLKRHRREMAGRVWVPEMWGQEKLLKDWVDCAIFDRPMVPTGLLTARRALIAECCSRRPNRTPSPASSTSSGPLPVRNGCS